MDKFFDDALIKEIKKCALNGANFGLGIGAIIGAAGGASLFGVGAIPGALICAGLGLGIGAAAGALYPIAKKLIIKAIKKLIEKYGGEAPAAAADDAGIDAHPENSDEHDRANSLIESASEASAIDDTPKRHSSLKLSGSYPTFFANTSASLSDDSLRSFSDDTQSELSDDTLSNLSDDESSESDLSHLTI